jgi:hypothetical protein
MHSTVFQRKTLCLMNAESAENAKMPRDAINCFIQTSKYFFSVLSESYLTSGQCYQGNIFPVVLPFISYYACSNFGMDNHRCTVQPAASIIPLSFLFSFSFLIFSLTFYVFPPSLSFTSPFSLSFLYLSPCLCFLSVFHHVCLIPTLPCN